MVMVLTIVAFDSAGKVDNSNLERADLRLRFSSGIWYSFPSIVGVCVRIRSGADGDGDGGDGDGVGDGDGDGDGVGDSDHSTRSTYTSRLATSTSASKLPQT